MRSTRVVGLLLLAVNGESGGLNVSVDLVLSGCDDSRDVGVGDLDGDGYADMVCPCKQRDEVVAVLSGFGEFSDRRRISLTQMTGRRNQGPRSVSVADIDGDGLDEIVVGYSAPGITLFVNNRDSPGHFQALTLRTPGMINAIRFVDIDGDHHLDILWIAQERNEIGWFINGIHSQGSNIMQQNLWKPTHLDPLNSILSRSGIKPPKKLHSALAADLDQDSLTDLVLLDNYAPPTVISPLIHLAHGKANFTTLDQRWHAGARDACLADLDGDSSLDLAIAYKTSDEISWYSLATGQRTVVCPPGQCAFACALVCADITGDGSIDIAVAEKKSNRVDLFSNYLKNGSSWIRTTLVHDLVHVGGIQPMNFIHTASSKDLTVPDALAFVIRGGHNSWTPAIETNNLLDSILPTSSRRRHKKRNRRRLFTDRWRRRLAISPGGERRHHQSSSNHSREVPGAFGILILHRDHLITPASPLLSTSVSPLSPALEDDHQENMQRTDPSESSFERTNQDEFVPSPSFSFGDRY